MSIKVLDGLMEVYLSYGQFDRATSEIWGHYSRNQLQPSEKTWNLVVYHHFKDRNLIEIKKIHQHLIDKQHLVNLKTLNLFLQTGLALRDKGVIGGVLEEFLRRSKKPTWGTLRLLSRLTNMPSDLFDKCMKLDD